MARERVSGKWRVTRGSGGVQADDAARRRLARAAALIRVGVGLGTLALAPLLPGGRPDDRALLVALVGMFYIPFALLSVFATRDSERAGAGLAAAAGDVILVFAFQSLVPQARTASLFAYLLVAVLHTFLCGWRTGLAVSGAALVLTLAAGTVTPSPAGPDLVTLAFYAGVLALVVLVLHAATHEQQKATERLALLHESLRSMSSSVAMGEMHAAVVASVRAALPNTGACVVLMEGRVAHTIAPAAGDGPTGLSSPLTRLRTYAGPGPWRMAMRSGSTVVRGVDGPHGDQGSIVCSPLVAAGAPIGVLVVHRARGEFREHDLVLIDAFAEQAASATARSTAFEQERAAARRLRDLDQLKSEFLSTVSHELRTPLTSIEGFSATLVTHWRRLGDEERLAFVRRVSKNAGELGRLIDQLLDFSRAEAGRIKVARRALNVRGEVEECLDVFADSVAKHRVHVYVPESLTAIGDADAFTRVLSNLVGNAAKYSEPGTSIRISGRQEQDEVVVSVADQGPGIKDEELDRVFDRFYQGSHEARGRRGTGVGLGIARRYVEAMGGRIWVDSRPGRGSTFSFALPARTAVSDASDNEDVAVTRFVAAGRRGSAAL